ncbi:tyrosine-type recombinase/integrase [Streptomyces sp. NPDC060011]|uniref:tyrosine-type recombinase/integrase n=1 Tax=Streptomyces sp. NPDC060011 TaxID=3347037 RepID=UPI0036A20C01
MFEGELLDRFVLAGLGAGISDVSLAEDRRILTGFLAWSGRRVWEVQASDVDGWLADLRTRGRARSTVYDRANTIARFYDFLTLRYQREVHARTGWVVVQPVDEFNRPQHVADVMVRVPPSPAEVAALFEGWRQGLPQARKYRTAARNYVVASLWRRAGLRIGESVKLRMGDWYFQAGGLGRLHVRFGKGSLGRGPREWMVPAIDGVDVLLRWWLEEVRPCFPDDHTVREAPLFPGERRVGTDGLAPAGTRTVREGLAAAVACHLPDWTGRLTPHVLRHACASGLYERGVDLAAIQDLLGHRWLVTTCGYIHVPPARIEHAWAQANARVADRLNCGESR